MASLPYPRSHPHAATPRHPHATTARHPHAADCVGIAGMPYPPIDSARGLLLCLTFEHKLVSDVQIAVEIQSGVSVVEVGAGLTAIEEVERTGFRTATAAWLSSCVRAWGSVSPPRGASRRGCYIPRWPARSGGVCGNACSA